MLTGFEQSAQSSRAVKNEPAKKYNLTLQVPTEELERRTSISENLLQCRK